MLNLLSNAIKFTEKGGVEVLLACNGTIYTVEVHDTGIGIEPEKVESMFDPFTQADASITRRFGGTGLGLAISRRFARALGGELTATSQPGVGTKMIFSFETSPLAGVQLLDATQFVTAASSAGGDSRKRWRLPAARVLVVDDGAENRELLSLVLTEQGLWVEEAENGQQALDKLAQASYDLVLMDMQMPVLDGYDATLELRRRGLDLPVVALTAHAMKGYQEEVLQAGCTAYLTKPIDIDALLQQVAQLLGAAIQESPQESTFVMADSTTIQPTEAEVVTGPIRSRFATTPNWRQLSESSRAGCISSCGRPRKRSRPAIYPKSRGWRTGWRELPVRWATTPSPIQLMKWRQRPRRETHRWLRGSCNA
ncbi:response regulator [Polaromonas sp. P2-4]|nr:response regulator [Polaromonas sp. P2-4]